jgi:hypothetical protein
MPKNAYVQDVRYSVVAWMPKNAYVQDVILRQKQVSKNNRHPEFILGSSFLHMPRKTDTETSSA